MALPRWVFAGGHTTILKRYHVWTRGSENRRMFGAMIVVGTAIVAVKVVAMIKDLFVASKFGASAEVDALLIAMVMPMFAINLIAGVFSSAFMPTYVRLHAQEGRDAASRLLATVSVATLGLLGVAAGLLALSIPFVLPFLTTGFDADTRELALHLSYLVAPSVVLSGAGTIWCGVLNAHDRFAVAEIAEITVPLCMVAALVGAGQRHGIYALAVGFVGGYALRLVLVALALWRAGHFALPRWRGWDDDVQLVVRQYLPVLGGGLLLGTAPLIDQGMAASLGEGSVASLAYGTKVVSLVLAVGSISVSRSVLPAFSRMVADSDYAAVRRTLRVYTPMILVGSIAITLGLVVLSEPITRLIFERGAFTAEDSRVVAFVQVMYALQIPFYILTMLYVRVISAMRANHILLIGTAFSFVINLSMNYFLKELMGVAGIALATTLVYVVSLGFLGTMVRRRLEAAEHA